MPQYKNLQGQNQDKIAQKEHEIKERNRTLYSLECGDLIG